MQISISEKIKTKVKDLKLGVIYANVTFEKYSTSLWEEINEESKRISQLQIKNIKEIPQIESSREAYKTLGKDPSRYRLSAEALHRRIIKGSPIYQISNIVDVINLSSLKTGYSIGGYDISKIQEYIIFDLGKKDEDYQAIGRGQMNIDNLPVFRDKNGAFGSPTSDSIRTMIMEKTSEILLIVINFGNHKNFEDDLFLISNLLKKFCSANKISTNII